MILRINQQPASDGMSLKEARKLLDAARDRVQLVVQREPGGRAEGQDANKGGYKLGNDRGLVLLDFSDPLSA